MFFVDLPTTRKKNKDINPGSNNATDHIPKATMQLRYLTATSTSCYILVMEAEKHGVEIIQNHWNRNLTSIPRKSKKSLNISPLDWHPSHLKEDKKPPFHSLKGWKFHREHFPSNDPPTLG